MKRGNANWDKPISQLHYTVTKFCISGFRRISRTVVWFRLFRNTPTNFRVRSLGPPTPLLFRGSAAPPPPPPSRYLPPERNKAVDRSSSPLYLSVARYCDIGMAGGAHLQAHPSYSAETLPLDEECTTSPGYKNVIVLHAHARLCLRRTKEHSPDRGS